MATKSAICRSAHTWDELLPFFICSWMRLSSSSLKDCRARRHRAQRCPEWGRFGGTAVVASLHGWRHCRGLGKVGVAVVVGG